VFEAEFSEVLSLAETSDELLKPSSIFIYKKILRPRVSANGTRSVTGP
jgi:hypothetical protein